MGSGGWVVMNLVMLAFWAWSARGDGLFRSGRSSNTSRPKPASAPEQLLDERFARVEIDGDEYTERRDVLRAAH